MSTQQSCIQGGYSKCMYSIGMGSVVPYGCHSRIEYVNILLDTACDNADTFFPQDVNQMPPNFQDNATLCPAECTCENGEEATGEACIVLIEEERCASCDGGYELTGSLCTECTGGANVNRVLPGANGWAEACAVIGCEGGWRPNGDSTDCEQCPDITNYDLVRSWGGDGCEATACGAGFVLKADGSGCLERQSCVADGNVCADGFRMRNFPPTPPTLCVGATCLLGEGEVDVGTCCEACDVTNQGEVTAWGGGVCEVTACTEGHRITN